MAGTVPKPLPFVGICVSGGGVRSAAFGLGALQSLQRHGKLETAAYLSAVSGGGYIAGAWTILRTHDGAAQVDPSKRTARPLEPESPEVAFIRARLNYLRGPEGWVIRILQLLGRLVANLVIIGAILVATGIAVGLAYSLGFSFFDSPPDWQRLDWLHFDDNPKDDPTAWKWLHVLTNLGVASLTFAVCLGVASVFDSVQASTVAPQLRRSIKLALWLAVGLLAFAWVTPQLIQLVAGDHFESLWASTVAFVGASGVSGIVGIVATLKGLTGDAGPSSSRLKSLLSKAITFLVTTAAAIAVPASALLLYIQVAATTYRSTVLSSTQLAWVIALAVALAVLYFFLRAADPQTWSLHSLYATSLGSCYVMEKTAQGQVGPTDPGSAPFPSWPKAGARTPDLIICASANMNDFGSAASGTDAVPFLFTAEGAGFAGELPSAETSSDSAPRTSIPAALTIAASIVGPTMGKYTKRAFASLITSLNLRLGVWLPNPNGKPSTESLSSIKTPARQRRRWKEFKILRSWYLVKEYVGSSSSTDPYIYVTDGGHYENLGLMELLRRQCDEIWCIDASGDPWGSAATIASAMRLASAELGVEWLNASWRRARDLLQVQRNGHE